MATTGALSQSGVDFSAWTLTAITSGGLSLAGIDANSVLSVVNAGKASYDEPLSLLHPGDTWGARENRDLNAWHITGNRNTNTGEVHIDNFNPNAGFVKFWQHAEEVGEGLAGFQPVNYFAAGQARGSFKCVSNPVSIDPPRRGSY